jgi:hypothetical protein
MSTSVLILLICTVLFFIALAYYWFKLRGVTSKLKQNMVQKSNNAKSSKSDELRQNRGEGKYHNEGYQVPVVKPMYKPTDVGHRTGHKRVFISSKGLRVYDTNEHGWPMPPLKPEESVAA